MRVEEIRAPSHPLHICDQEKQLIFSKLQEMTKCRIYKHLIDGVYLQYHLMKAIPKKCMKYLTKFRLSSHSLAVETGRYRGVPFSNSVGFAFHAKMILRTNSISY